MGDFLNKKMDGEEMCDQVYELRHKLMNTGEKFKLKLILSSEKINDFQPDDRSKNIGGFLTGLCCEYDDFLEDYENEVFYKNIQNGFLNFQNN